MKLFISPHNDDETLFGAFTIMKEKPHVSIVFDSYVQYERGNWAATVERRRHETAEALLHFGYSHFSDTFLGLRDDAPDYDYLRAWLKQRRDDGQFDGIICPAWEQDGHEQHNGVARICRDLWPDEQRTEYLTYTRTGGRSRSWKREMPFPNGENTYTQILAGVEVIPTPEMIARKHRALACYKSQMEVPDCTPWFMGDIREYLALPPADSERHGVDVGGKRP